MTYQPDNFRNNLLYLPVGAILSIFWLGFGFEVIEPIVRLNPIILAALGAPLIYNGSISLTDQFIFPNNKIVYGPCPVCETETRVYFGDILGVEVRVVYSVTLCLFAWQLVYCKLSHIPLNLVLIRFHAMIIYNFRGTEMVSTSLHRDYLCALFLERKPWGFLWHIYFFVPQL